MTVAEVASSSGGGEVTTLLRRGLHYDLLVPDTAQNQEALAKVLQQKGPKVSREKAKVLPQKGPKEKKALPKQENKEEKALLKRKSTPGPFGACPRLDCCAPLKLIPPMPGGRPLLGCPRFRTGKCKGHVRDVRPDEQHLLPKKMFCLVKLS